MGIFDRLRPKQKEPAPEAKGLDPNTGGVLVGTIPVNVAAMGTYGSGAFVKAYRSSADLYSVASFLIRKMASIPWYVYTQKEGPRAKMALNRYQTLTKGLLTDAVLQRALVERKAAYDENQILDDKTGLGRLMARPNEMQGQDQFFESVFGFRVLSGEANIWGNSGRDPEGEIVELQALPTQFVEDYYDPKDLYGVLGYKLNVGGAVNIPKQNLLRWKNWRPDFDAATRIHMRGLSVVEVGWKTYLMNDYGAEATANMLKNGGAKGALSPKVINNQYAKLDQTQLDKATSAVNKRINGLDHANQVGVLAGPYDYLSFGLSATDMAVVEIMNLTLEQWCRMLGLPPVLFNTGSMADNNYQNALRDLVTNTVVPMLASFRDQLNKWLLPRFQAEGRFFIDFDISALPELQRDIEKLVNSLAKAYWLEEDEKRIMMNYEPKGGAYATSLVPSGLTPIEMVGEDISIKPDPEDEPAVDY